MPNLQTCENITRCGSYFLVGPSQNIEKREGIATKMRVEFRLRRIETLISADYTEIILASAENIDHNIRITGGDYHMYIWQKPDWPACTWDERSLARPLAHVSREQGRLPGKMETLGFELRSEAHLRTLTEDVIKSSEIEGEKLEQYQVR